MPEDDNEPHLNYCSDKLLWLAGCLWGHYKAFLANLEV